VLVAVAALIGWEAASIVRSNAPTLTNPDKADLWVITAGVLAAAFCIQALWCLRRVWQGRGRWSSGVFVSYSLALIALYGVLIVAGLAGLGG